MSIVGLTISFRLYNEFQGVHKAHRKSNGHIHKLIEKKMETNIKAH